MQFETFKLEKILPLIEYGHLDAEKIRFKRPWINGVILKVKKPDIKLHLVGKLQSNKVKFAAKIFDFIHSVDTKKLAKKLLKKNQNLRKKLKFLYK